MAREIRISFYKVQKCAYFKRGDDTPHICSLSATLNGMQEWIVGARPTIRETQTFAPHADANYLPVYCYNINRHGNSGDYILTTWNETEQAEGRIASVQAGGRAGNAKISSMEVPPDSLPGYPAYFWFIPSLSLVACIRLKDQRLGGNPGMAQYLSGYLERFSPWVVLDEGSTCSPDVEVVGYRDGRSVRTDLKPRFVSAPLRLEGEIDFIRNNRQRIQKIIRKDEYCGGAIQNAPVLRSMLRKLGLREPPQELDSTRYRFELEYRPSAQELNKIISEWQSHADAEDATSWDDVGFRFQADSDIRWLSQSAAKQTLDVDIRLRDDVLIEAETLMAELQRNREVIINRIPQSE